MKTSTFKRLSALLLAFCLIFSFAFTSCNNDKGGDDDDGNGGGGDSDIIDAIGGVSETFTGTLSSESYDSAQEAAQAYVVKEMATNDDVVIEDVKTTSLSNDEIKDAGIPDEFLSGADSVEKVEISYLVTRNETMSLSTASVDGTAKKDTLNKEKTVVVYVIKYGTDWKYFTPLPETNTTLSKSYYDSVFNPENFENCTMKYDNDITISASAQGQKNEYRYEGFSAYQAR